MTRPPGDLTRLAKLKANQEAAIARAQHEGPGPVILWLVGWNVFYLGCLAPLFFDWHWLIVGVVLGLGNVLWAAWWMGTRRS